MWKRPRTLHLRHLTDDVRAASDHAAIDADIMLSSELRPGAAQLKSAFRPAIGRSSFDTRRPKVSRWSRNSPAAATNRARSSCPAARLAGAPLSLGRITW